MLGEEPEEQTAFKLPIQPDAPMRKGLYVVIAILVVMVLGLGGAVAYMMVTPTVKRDDTMPALTVKTGPSVLELDTKKSYGNKYANGLLPVGDGKYSSDSAKKGSLYACSQYALSVQGGGGGAGSRGPWFVSNNTQYDLNKKAHVRGSVNWQGTYSSVISGGTRRIATNDLPLSHATGVFPIASSDPAHAYDKNPNSIKAQTLSYLLTASPVYGDAQCMGGEVGVMTTGVALFNAFDAGGRDAGAWEVQDDCGGHPQVSGEYHYHTLSSCIKDVSVQTVIGFALDGFPITGPQVSSGNFLTTDDLDECHGIKSEIMLDGKTVKHYHYVMTQDFPYSVSCFRAKASDPPGQHEGGPTQGTSQMQSPPPPKA
jgi:hypothetical protein